MRVNFIGLQAFLSVAERGSFKRAAIHLNLSQTAVSHRLRKLEAELGLQLFVRTTREVSLTRAGVDLMAKARKAVSELEDSLTAIRQDGTNRQKLLSIGCLPGFATYLLPPVLSKFWAHNPNVDVRIFERSSFEIAELLQREEIEFALTVVSTNRWDLDTETIVRTDPLVVACHPRHELANKRDLRWSDLRGVPMIRVCKSNTIRDLIDDALGITKEDMNWRVEVQRIETALSMVERRCGVTIAPRCSVNLFGGKAVIGKPIRKSSVTCAFGFATKRGVPLSPIAERLEGMMREELLKEHNLKKIALTERAGKL